MAIVCVGGIILVLFCTLFVIIYIVIKRTILHEVFRHLRACLGDAQLNYSWLYVHSRATSVCGMRDCSSQVRRLVTLT